MSAPEPAIPTSNPRTRAIPVVVLIAKELTYEEQALLTQRVRGLLAKGKIAPELLLH